MRAKVVEVSSQPQRLVLSLTGRGRSFDPAACVECYSALMDLTWDLLCPPGNYRLQKGGTTMGMVTNILPQFGLQLRLPFGAVGTVGVTDLADDYKPRPLDEFSKDQLLRWVGAPARCPHAASRLSQLARISLCRLWASGVSSWRATTGSGGCLCVRPGGKASESFPHHKLGASRQISLVTDSLLLTRLDRKNANAAMDPEVLSVHTLEVGQMVRGYVKSAGEQGVFIR